MFDEERQLSLVSDVKGQVAGWCLTLHGMGLWGGELSDHLPAPTPGSADDGGLGWSGI